MGYPSDVSADDGFPVTPSDTTVLTNCTGIYVGGTGNVSVVTLSGKTLAFLAVPAGVTIRLKIKQVLATGLTASNIIGLQ